MTVKKTKIAIFGAGCFWGVEEAFRTTKGVVSTEAGYSGGSYDNPTYEDVCSGMTGHAEGVKVEYDSKKVSYNELLKVFWGLHDPTQLDRQGPDLGNQYRSVIFYFDDSQKKDAKKSLKEEQRNYSNPIATKIEKAKKFWKAEEYHQKYIMKTGRKVC